MSDEEKRTDLVRVTGLWRKERADASDGNGRFYLSGSFGSATLLVYPNSRRKAPTDPDYIAYIAPTRERTAPNHPEVDKL